MPKQKIIKKNYKRESTRLTDVSSLRNHALETLEKLASGEIDTAEAGVTGKLCESVIATVKAELEYAKLLGKEPNISFMGDISKNRNLAIEGSKEKIGYLTNQTKER